MVWWGVSLILLCLALLIAATLIAAANLSEPKAPAGAKAAKPGAAKPQAPPPAMAPEADEPAPETRIEAELSEARIDSLGTRPRTSLKEAAKKRMGAPSSESAPPPPAVAAPAPSAPAPQALPAEPKPRPRVDDDEFVGGGRLEEAAASAGERVTLSGFAPKAAKPGARVLVQAFIHAPSQTEIVRAMAKDRDPGAGRAGSQALAGRAKAGDRIRLRLEASGLKIEEPVQDFVWSGETIAAGFIVRLPRWKKTPDYFLKIVVEINGAPAGRLTFRLQINRRAKKAAVEALPAYEPYRYAFLSYASEDRAFAESRARTLEQLGVGYFLDVESLRAGEDWQAKLREHIERADVFMLFWSPSAAKSQWVRREAKYALLLQQKSATAEPLIKPYNVDPRRIAKPPKELSHLHFATPRRG